MIDLVVWQFSSLKFYKNKILYAYKMKKSAKQIFIFWILDQKNYC